MAEHVEKTHKDSVGVAQRSTPSPVPEAELQFEVASDFDRLQKNGLLASRKLNAHSILQLQRTIGNHALAGILASQRHETSSTAQRSPKKADDGKKQVSPEEAEAQRRQMLIDQIRRGVTVALSIPNAFASPEDAEEKLTDPAGAKDGLKFAWGNLPDTEEGVIERIQTLWQAFRDRRSDIFGEFDVEAEQQQEADLRVNEAEYLAGRRAEVEAMNQQDSTDKKLTKVQRNLNRRKNARALSGEQRNITHVQGLRKNAAASLNKLRAALRVLPGEYGAGASEKDRKLIRAALMTYSPVEVKDYLWKEHKPRVAKGEYLNNAEFQGQAGLFAQAHNALAVNSEGQLTLGQHMTYNSKDEIGHHVNAVYTAARTLLAETGEESPDQIARIHYLALFAHGSSGWMGGHHEASASNFRLNDVPAIVSTMSNTLSSDVRLALFACSTASDRSKKKEHAAGENAMADTFAEELAKHHEDAFVTGHTNPGHTVRNANLRTFTGTGNEGGADIAVKRPRGSPLLSDEFVISEASRLEIEESPESTKMGIHPKEAQLRNAMIDCYATEVAFFRTLPDAKTAADLRPEFEEVWHSLVSPESKVAEAIRKGKYRENWANLQPRGSR